MTTQFNDRYGIADPAQFDALEVQGVREYSDDDGGFIEVDNENPQFFSTYAHCKTGGVECIGDFATAALARAYAAELSKEHGWPVYDYIVNEVAQP